MRKPIAIPPTERKVCAICQNTGQPWSGGKVDRLPHTLRYVGVEGEYAHMRCIYETAAKNRKAD